MTHEEIVKEFRKIGKYLQNRAKDIKARYGENPVLANEEDKWHYELLMQVCQTVQEHQCIRPYIEVQVPDIRVAHNGYGVALTDE